MASKGSFGVAVGVDIAEIVVVVVISRALPPIDRGALKRLSRTKAEFQKHTQKRKYLSFLIAFNNFGK